MDLAGQSTTPIETVPLTDNGEMNRINRSYRVHHLWIMGHPHSLGE